MNTWNMEQMMKLIFCKDLKLCQVTFDPCCASKGQVFRYDFMSSVFLLKFIMLSSYIMGLNVEASRSTCIIEVIQMTPDGLINVFSSETIHL